MTITVGDVRAMAVQLRDLELRRAETKERLSSLDAQIKRVTIDHLPELMRQAGVDHVGIPREGNLPAYELRLTDVVQANIAAAWPEERRRAAFDWLDANGHGDLVATEVVLSFPRERREEALTLAGEMRRRQAQGQLSAHVGVREAVHPSTLKAWLKTMLKTSKRLPPLETIGGSLLRIATLKQKQQE